MTTLAGVFLIVHGVLHVAIWLPPAGRGAPFDPGHSWLLGDAPAVARPLALLACTVLALSGVLVLAGSGAAAKAAIAGASVSLALVVLTFHPWLAGALAIDLAIAAVAIA